MKRLLFLLLAAPFFGFAQNTIGFPEVTNYSKGAYKGGLQNWDIKQAANGMIYIANNEGVLSFDGVFWNLYPLPNKTNVRSVETGADNHIYAGGQDELGYFAPASNGRLQYVSLVQFIDQKHRSFGDVWDIVSLGKDIFFRTLTKIFQFNGRNITVYPATSEWSFLGKSNSKLYAHDYAKGLQVFNENRWQPATVVNTLPVNDPVTSILEAGNSSSIITTLKNGLYQFNGNTINAIPSANNELFKKQRIYAAVKISNEWVALATNNGGVYIIDASGSVIQQFSKTEGLHDNNVLSIFYDKQQNLWLGLDNGVDFIAYNSAIKQMKPMMNEASGYALLVKEQELFAGTSAGLYRVPLQAVEDLSFSKGSFEQVSNTKGQVWNLTEINNNVLMGHHEGAFVINKNNAVQISAEPGFWNFIPLSSVYPAQEIAAGNYKGIRFFNYNGSSFIPTASVAGFDESSRFIVADKNEMLWMSHPYHGVFRIQKNKDGSMQVFSYADKKGLPSALNNHAYNIKNELVIATENGVYVYNTAKDEFEASPFYNKLLGTQSIRYLKEDKNGNIWFIHEKTLGVIDFSDNNNPKIIYLPELTAKMLSGFELIYPLDDKNIFMGGEKGFYHINFENYKRSKPVLNVQVRRVIISHQKDSLLFGGYFADVNAEQKQQASQIQSIPNRWKTIQIEFSSSSFGYQSNLEYSYRLIGFTDNWSEWSNRTDKEYTNLNAGKYKFEVKVRNNLGNESVTAVYEFTVLPPWYTTWWAKALYALLAVSIMIFLYRRHLKKLEAQQEKFEEEQRKLKYIHELELNKTESEMVALRNEKLESEISFKNSEVAAAAMHLVKKSELLTKIKADLTQMMKRVENEQAVSEIKKMIKSLNEDEHIDEEWENFSKHFDKVHSDFIVRLKEVHPNLTGNDLKLCTYLRMNLSTKEIAQLMNISGRGVEISRYRLRKKLGIVSEMSLFDYLLSLKS
jgi:ligand-binding sensor domain-containing protein/DNA-binding CsgD family transcriptional regulator